MDRRHFSPHGLWAGAFPPPSPWSTTSWDSSSCSPSRSPSSAAATKRVASSSGCSREASKRGRRRSSTWRRARVVSCRAFCSLVPMICGDGKRRRAKRVELLLGHRSAESLREALPPARIARLPAELALGLLVRGSLRLGRHERCRLTRQQPSEPAWYTPWWLGAQRARQHRQPLPHGRGVVVDDVVDTRLAVVDRGDGRGGGVVNVDVREDAAAAAEDWEPTLAHR